MQETLKECSEPNVIQTLTAELGTAPFEDRQSELIQSYLENALAADVRATFAEHVEKCVACQEQVARFQKLNSCPNCTERFTFASCPSSALLDSYLYRPDGLDAWQRQSVRSHLTVCEFCQREVDWLKKNPPIDERAKPEKARAEREAWWWPVRTSRLIAGGLVAALVLAVTFFGYQSWSQWNLKRQLARLADFPEIDYAEFTSAAFSSEESKANFLEAVVFVQAQRYQEAVPRLERVLNASPQLSGAWFLQGYCYLQLRDVSRAHRYFDAAEKIEPKSGQRCFFMANCSLLAGDAERAIRELSVDARPDGPHFQRSQELLQKVLSVQKKERESPVPSSKNWSLLAGSWILE